MTSFSLGETIAWITILFLVAAIPLTIMYFRNKNADSHLSKLKTKPTQTPTPADFTFNFDNNWSPENDNSDYAVNVETDKKLAKIILKTIALNGEMGMLVKQISDILELHEIEVNYSLNYLTRKGFIESVNSQKGNIHYLTVQGTSYCNKKGFISEVA